MVEREASQRESRQTAARLRRAKLRFSDASPEDIDYRTARGLDRALTARLLTCEWIRERQNLILVAPTGLGKSWLGCAFAVQACRQGFSACYLRVPKLNEELAIAHGSGRYARWLTQLAKTDVVILDDFAMAPLSDSARRDLLEVLDDRHGNRSTLATSQLLRARARARARNNCNAMMPSASSGFPSMHNRCSVQRRNQLICGFEATRTQLRRHDRFERF
ncbi:IstB ATP binding domain-containing protein [Paraburkholderia hospita]|uniref:IstB ATP binding domain-containing protein n=1 Tax=Paraburkholderia hospita TaxID=169430 RepID=A0ABN0F492_9BURK|nr:IstB ATP binding domain-containing protein [Paraburkholderia hospita]